MSNPGNYYVAHRKLTKLHRLWLLKAPQLGTANGGGADLLGSVVREERQGGPVLGEEFPVPELLLSPEKLISQRVATLRKVSVSIVERSIPIAGPEYDVEISKSASFSLGVGPFPSVPVGLGVTIDRERMKKLSIRMEDAEIRYIPPGDVGALYQSVDGDHGRIDASRLIDDGRIVWKVLLAKSYSAEFVSSEKFAADFDAKLEAFKKLPSVSSKVTYERVGDTTLRAKISGDVPYLVGLEAWEWRQFKFD